MARLRVRVYFSWLFLLPVFNPSAARQQEPPAAELAVARIFNREKDIANQTRWYTARAEMHLDISERSLFLMVLRPRQYENAGRIDFSQISQSVRKLKWKLPGTILLRLDPAGLIFPSPLDPETFTPDNFQLVVEKMDSTTFPPCYVFRVEARKRQKWGHHWVHFQGRIWVRPEDSTIVHFQGDYVPSTKLTSCLQENSWFSIDIRRDEVLSHVWLPVEVTTENREPNRNRDFPKFKAVVTFRDFAQNSNPPPASAFSPIPP